MIPRNWRINIFNWLGAGKVILEKDKVQEQRSMTYSIAGAGYGNGITLGPQTQGPLTGQTLTLKITPANGGHIVSVTDTTHTENLYIIADDADFDRELGKIITVTKLKS